MYRWEFVLSHMDRLEDKLSDDRLLFITLLSLAEKFYCVPDCLYVHAHRVPTLRKKAPAISVVVPMYNVERYVEESIKSVLNQRFSDFELIIIDDCSTDGSYEICRRLASQDGRIKLFRQEKNQGQGVARNVGMAKARGKYIYFFDSDDILLPNSLELLYNAAETSGADVVNSSSWFEQAETDVGVFEPTLRALSGRMKERGFIVDDKNIRLKNYYVPQLILPMVVLNIIRRDFIERHDIRFPGILSEDEAFIFTLQRFANRFFCIDERFYVYRRRGGSTMSSLNPERAKRCASSIVDGIKYITDIAGDEILPSIRNECINTFAAQLINNFVLRFYRAEDIFDDKLSRNFIEALRPTFDGSADIAAHFLQGYAAQILWKNILQYRLLNLPTPPPSQDEQVISFKPPFRRLHLDHRDAA